MFTELEDDLNDAEWYTEFMGEWLLPEFTEQEEAEDQ